MSLFKKITDTVSGAADTVNDWFEPKEDGSSWGNGVLADWVHGDDPPPNGTGSFGEGMYDMAQNLGSSNGGTNEHWAGSQRTWDSFSAGGVGLGGDAWGRGPGADQARGYGLGGGHWTSQTADGNRQASGYGGGAGVSNQQHHEGEHDALGNYQYGFEQYQGVGGNAYQFHENDFTDMFGNSHGGANGYGLDANYTKQGYNNVTGSFENEQLGVSGNGTVDNVVVGQMNGSLEGGQADDGTYFGRAAWAPGRTEVHNANGSLDSPLGHTDVHMGSYGTGPRYGANGMYDPNTGNMSGGANWAGGGWKVQDASVNHDFGNGVTTNASVGTIDTSNDWSLNGGWNNETGNAQVDGTWNTGNTVENANFHLGDGDTNLDAHMGRYTDGNHFDGTGTFGRDGVHVNGNGTWGGFDVQDAGVSYGQEGTFYNSMHADSFGTSTQLRGAGLDIDGDGVRANVDSLRTGGFRADGISGHNDIGGVTTDYSLGHVSNDFLMEGAGLDINGDGVHAEVANLDFGGIRVNDWNSQTNMGDAGTLNTHLGSFSNGNTITNAHFDANGDGVNFGAERIGALGMDINDASVGWEGPGGAYANASMGSLHTGLGIDGLTGGINSDGLNVHADHADYTTMQLQDVNANYNIPGMLESHAHVGAANYNSFSGDNLNVQADMDGLGVSGDNLAYSYIGASDVHTSQSIGDGAVTTNLDLGRGSFGGGHADHLDFHTDGFNSDLAVENLNAHGLQLDDAHVGVGIGDGRVDVGADTLNVLDLNVGHADAHTSNMGLTGNANVQDANLDLLNIQGGNIGIGYDGQQIVGASGDYRSRMSVGNANADWDLTELRAGGSFEDAHYANQLSNASVNFMGSEIDIPDMGFDVNASGHANADLMNGQLGAGLNLSGSSVNFAGYEMELGDWAQASADMDLSRGAVNANIGGENGVGVNASLADANLDLDLFGAHIDVDERLRDGADWVASTASDAWDWGTSVAGDAWEGITDVAGGAASLAGDAWDGVSGFASDAGSAVASFFSGW